MELVGYFYMAMLSLQFGSQPLLTQKFVSPLVLTSMMVLVTEFSKALISVVILFINRPPDLKSWTVRSCIYTAGMPALSYAIQNQLNYVAMRNLDGVSYVVLNQSKIIATALCVYLFVGVIPTTRQIIGMSLLMVGVALVITVDEATPTTGNMTFGMCNGVAASLLSGFGAGLSQRALQLERRDSIMFSGELGFMSGLFQAATLPFLSDVHRTWAAGHGLFIGFTPWTILPLISQACGGFMVGLVTKYAGSVAKGYTVIFGIIITILLKTMIERVHPHPQVGVAVLIVSVSVYLHTSKPAKKGQ